MRHLLLLCTATLLATSSSSAQDGREQIWQGVLDVGQAKLRLQFRIARSEAGEFSGVMVSLDQGNAKVPLSGVTIEGDEVTLELKAAGARFVGRLDAAKKQVVGKWSQGGNDFDLTLERHDKVVEDKHVETWQGTMKAGGRAFEFQVRVFVDAKGKKLGKLDSFSEKLFGLPIDLTEHDDAFNFELSITKAKYEGTYDAERAGVTGHWLQSGGRFPLNFTRIDLARTRTPEPRSRPQHPKPPYPYKSEDVSWENRADNITLAATLTMPKGDGPFPVAVLITGSGPEDRDETIFEHKPFLVIADDLTRRGIAVLRYDERGVGQSGGVFAGATSEDFARDVASAVDYLKTRADIDPRQIGLIGHSEGGLIGPMVATKRTDIAWLVLLAGPGVNGEVIGITQSRAMATAEGTPKAIVDAQEEMLKTLFAALRKDGRLSDDVKNAALAEFMKAIPEDIKERVDVAALAEAGLGRLDNPWLKYFLTYEPGPVLQKVKCPVLALNGTTDLQVDADVNLAAIEKALKAGGNADFEVTKLAKLNHLFQTSETGKLSEYIEIEETFAPAALEAMAIWLAKRVRLAD